MGSCLCYQGRCQGGNKGQGDNGNSPHPSQFPDPPPNLSLSDDKYRDEDNDEESVRDSKFGRN